MSRHRGTIHTSKWVATDDGITWPKIPTVIQGAGGPITVRLARRIVYNRTTWWGDWNAHTRVVRIDRAAPIAHQWRTLFHELAHAALTDSGLAYLFSEDGNEALCDAVATARIVEMRAQLIAAEIP